MHTIWKFPLEVDDSQTITMPKGARILAVQVQHGRPCLWALVDANEDVRETVEIRTHGTGHRIPEGDARSYEYIATYQLQSGAFVFHAFRLAAA